MTAIAATDCDGSDRLEKEPTNLQQNQESCTSVPIIDKYNSEQVEK